MRPQIIGTYIVCTLRIIYVANNILPVTARNRCCDKVYKRERFCDGVEDPFSSDKSSLPARMRKYCSLNKKKVEKFLINILSKKNCKLILKTNI